MTVTRTAQHALPHDSVLLPALTVTGSGTRAGGRARQQAGGCP